jgi:3-isopropylmalate/(R)-2-methylmalate dehydratase large subunit
MAGANATRGRTLVEKIAAKASGREDARAGDLVTAEVDLCFAHDSSGPRRWAPMLAELGRGLWDPSKVVIASDHYVPAVDAESAAILSLTRRFAAEHGVVRFYDMEGIGHMLLAERGLVRPGMLVAGGDSHTPMAGAFGAYAAGYGATDMAAIAATGRTWLQVPATIRVEWRGALADGVTAKDMMLFLCRELDMDNAFRAVEFAGPTVEAMSMPERLVLTNMAAELGAETGVVDPDATTFAWLRDAGAPVEDEAAARAWASDPDADYEAVHRFDTGALEPMIALPHSPANSVSVAEAGGRRIDQAYVGACVGAKLEDLHMASRVLAGQRIAPGVRLLVAPASSRVTEAAARDGTLACLMAAGATLMPSGCGACAGMGAGLLAEGEVCISTTNRNFKGRMGHAGAEVYLGSPYSVAAAAIAGRIIDPRGYLGQRRAAA